MTVRAEFEFFEADEGGYRAPFDTWPAQINIRTHRTGDLSYGALLRGESGLRVLPGDRVVLEVELFDGSSEAAVLHPGAVFRFGDIRDRGQGRVLSNE